MRFFGLAQPSRQTLHVIAGPGNSAPFEMPCSDRLADSIKLYWLRVNPWEINRREAKVSKPIATSITTPKVDANEKSALRSQ